MARINICPFCGNRLELVGNVVGERIHNEVYPKVKYSYVYHNKFEKGHIWLFPKIPMFCSKCGVQINLKTNSYKICDYVFGILCFANLVCLIFLTNLWMYCFVFSVIIYLISMLISIVLWNWTNRLRNNYTFSISNHLPIYNFGDYHSERPTIRATMKQKVGSKTNKYIVRSNIFSIEVEKTNVFLYLVDFEKNKDRIILHLRICGNYESASRTTHLIRKRMTINGFSIPFRYDGNFIAVANVTDVSDITHCDL